MLSPKIFFEELKKHNINFFTGVPDSLLKSFCAYITDNTDEKNNIIAANEGNAIGLATGYYISTGYIPLVYLQNSGEGNIINPICSLADDDIFGIPMLLLIGWRGEPNIHDEPQHIKQGKVTLNILDSIGIKYDILSDNENEATCQITKAYDFMLKNKSPYALVVRKNVFDEYKLQNKKEDKYSMSREDAISRITELIDKQSLIISTTGMISRELYEIREKNNSSHNKELLVIGAMGHASSIALSIALNTDKQIYCFDGDGALIMHMGALAVNGYYKPHNLCHIVFNNGAHDSVGGQPTVAMDINLCNIALGCNYEYVERVTEYNQIENALIKAQNKYSFIEIMVKKGNRKDLGRPKHTPKENLKLYMDNFNNHIK